MTIRGVFGAGRGCGWTLVSPARIGALAVLFGFASRTTGAGISEAALLGVGDTLATLSTATGAAPAFAEFSCDFAFGIGATGTVVCTGSIAATTGASDPALKSVLARDTISPSESCNSMVSS